MPWVPHGLVNGTITTRWPRRADRYFDDFPAAIDVVGPTRVDEVVHAAADACPTQAIRVGSDGASVDGVSVDRVSVDRVSVDRGRCILCGRCTRLAPQTFAFVQGSATSSLDRRALVVGEREETEDELALLRAALAERVRHLRRSVHIRHVDAGSDGSDEWELQALVGPVYDIHRLGIFFTASPRHADVLLVTGIGTAGMAGPLRRTREGMPDPVVVMAVGTDAVSGGLIGGGYTGGVGVAQRLDVDVWVPGSPASPFSVLHGILLALGRVPGASATGGSR